MGILQAAALRFAVAMLEEGVARTNARRAATDLATKAATYPAWLQRTGEAERFSIPAGTLPATQAQLYQHLSWVQIAVGTLARTAAGTCQSVSRRTGEDLTAVVNHPFELLLQRPNPLMSRFEFLEATFAYRGSTGNAYWWLNRPNERAAPSELWLIPPHKIAPVPDGKLFLRGYLYEPGGGQEPVVLDPWEIVHFKLFHPANAYVGLSPIEALAAVATGDLAMQQWNANFFGKDNAKVPGFLAFKDRILEQDWERLKAETKRQFSGTKRSLMMLQGVGAGGVEWVSTSLSQKDMDFLASRTFTKEEIFAIFAPGLASVLAVNATEANATAGMNTLLNMAVWPAHVAVAEKITNDLLPAYGPNLVAAFEDVRMTDRALELAEEQAFSAVHTIDEIRQEKYGDDPIGDERGRLLPAEIGKGLTDGRTVEEKREDEPEPMAAPSGSIIDVTPEPLPEQLAEAQPPEPLPEQLAEAQPPTPPQLPAPDAVAARAADLDRWQRKAVKRVQAGKSALVGFESDYIDAGTRGLVMEALADADTVEAVKAAFVIKATSTNLTPAERALADRIAAVFEAEGRAAVTAMLRGEVVDFTTLEAGIRSALVRTMTAVVVERATELAEQIGPDFDPLDMANRANPWMQQYLAERVEGVIGTTRRYVEQAVDEFRRTPGMTRDQLTGMLLDLGYSATRADTISITAITEAASQATNHYQSLLKDAGITMERIWQTNADEGVCAICVPLNGLPESEWADAFPGGPPGHVRCRCASTLRVVK